MRIDKDQIQPLANEAEIQAAKLKIREYRNQSSLTAEEKLERRKLRIALRKGRN